jgi:hypothetical protein
MGGTGVVPVRKYREALGEEKEHLKKHIRVHFADDEIRIGYGIACDDGDKCTFPKSLSRSPESHPRVTASICPKSGTTRARSYTEASDKHKEHLLEHMTLQFADDEVKMGYVIDCSDQNCTFPHTTVTFTVCPKQPCIP